MKPPQAPWLPVLGSYQVARPEKVLPPPPPLLLELEGAAAAATASGVHCLEEVVGSGVQVSLEGSGVHLLLLEELASGVHVFLLLDEGVHWLLGGVYFELEELDFWLEDSGVHVELELDSGVQVELGFSLLLLVEDCLAFWGDEEDEEDAFWLLLELELDDEEEASSSSYPT
jgi:hypothetical protein